MEMTLAWLKILQICASCVDLMCLIPEKLVRCFCSNENLGVGGGPMFDQPPVYMYRGMNGIKRTYSWASKLSTTQTFIFGGISR